MMPSDNAALTDQLWDALRVECCSTGLKAHRIVMLSRPQLALAIASLSKPSGRPGCRFCGGTGQVSYSAGGDTRLDKCGCLEAP